MSARRRSLRNTRATRARVRKEARSWHFRFIVLDGLRMKDARRTRYRSLDLERAKLACVRFAFTQAPEHAMILDQLTGTIVFDVWRNGRTMSWR